MPRPIFSWLSWRPAAAGLGSAMQVDAELEDALSLAAAEVSAFSLQEALPVLRELAVRRSPVLSAKVDEHFGSVEVVFPEHILVFSVKDPYQARCLASACRVASPTVVGVVAQADVPGALLLVSAPPWSVYLEFESVRDLSHS